MRFCCLCFCFPNNSGVTSSSERREDFLQPTCWPSGPVTLPPGPQGSSREHGGNGHRRRRHVNPYSMYPISLLVAEVVLIPLNLAFFMSCFVSFLCFFLRFPLGEFYEERKEDFRTKHDFPSCVPSSECFLHSTPFFVETRYAPICSASRQIQFEIAERAALASKGKCCVIPCRI